MLAALPVASQTSNASPPSSNSAGTAHLPVCDADHPDPTTEILSTCSADLSQYIRVIKSRVERGWYSLTSRDPWMRRACAVVDFTIRPDGGVSALKIPRSTGDPHLDRAALGGIVSPAPFPPTPAGCAQGVNFRFRMYYNTDGGATPHPTSVEDRATAPDNEPVTRDKSIAPPVWIYSPNPSRAPAVMNAPISPEAGTVKGRVLLTAVVTSKGDVASAEIVRAAGNGFDEYAMANVVMSKFRPATLAGIPVRTEVTLRVDLQ